MKFDISITTEITPEIINYIQKGIDATPYCTETIESIEKAVVHNQGCVWTIKLGQELYGVMVTSFMRSQPKNLFTIFILSGKNIELWKEQFHDFIIDTIRTMNARLIVTGRRSWKRMFPILKEAGMVFTLE